MKFTSRSVEETREIGAKVAATAAAGDVYALVGGLGAGKTEFVRGFVAALGAQAGVRSPTFTLVNTYQTRAFAIHHFDFYRLTKESELTEIGFAEYFEGMGVCLVEWADMFPSALPPNTRRIKFTEGNDHERIIEVEKAG